MIDQERCRRPEKNALVYLFGKAGLIVLLLPLAATAAKVVHEDGRVLSGRIGLATGVAEDPNAAPRTSGGVAVRPILILDDGLRRMFVPKARIGSINETSRETLERISVPQPVAQSGHAIAGVGPAVGIEPFDKHGRRIFSMTTSKGQVDIIQGITEITPRYTKVEALGGPRPYKSYVWEMRIATSGIPRDVLSSILHQAVDPDDLEQRLRIVRLYLQSERYADAREELRRVLEEFPRADDLDAELRALRQLGARRLLREIEMRRRAGQFELAASLLRSFPADGVAGETLAQVREILREDQALRQQVVKIRRRLAELADQLRQAPIRQRMEPILAELDMGLDLNTVGRMAAFARLADDTHLSPAQKLALAASGWLVGSNHALESLPVAVSLYEVRDLVGQYLRAEQMADHQRLLDTLRSREGATPARVAQLLAQMAPPLETGPEAEPGSGVYVRTVPGLVGQEDVTYSVQLPPEYDPYRRYPTIVTLPGSGSTPEMQIDWWAGGPTGQGMRQGQAMRHGYITLAVKWQKPYQLEYHYSARAHHAVLASLRDAQRRFSIDTDRVFLSGHDIGGDAAWDIGLAHPDLWAGVILVVAVSDRYCTHYWENAANLPLYFVAGELDGDKIYRNAINFDRYLRRKYDATVVEYLGRGHEHFHDEIQDLFDWMGRRRRNFFPAEFEAVTMRAWDSFFWWLELSEVPERSIVDPVEWPPPRGTNPLKIQGSVKKRTNIFVRAGSEPFVVWLTPELVDFDQRISLRVNGRLVRGDEDAVRPSIDVMLSDARTRGDRQHPFWARWDVR